jgi:hypothetical protein
MAKTKVDLFGHSEHGCLTAGRSVKTLPPFLGTNGHPEQETTEDPASLFCGAEKADERYTQTSCVIMMPEFDIVLPPHVTQW